MKSKYLMYIVLLGGILCSGLILGQGIGENCNNPGDNRKYIKNDKPGKKFNRDNFDITSPGRVTLGRKIDVVWSPYKRGTDFYHVQIYHLADENSLTDFVRKLGSNDNVDAAETVSKLVVGNPTKVTMRGSEATQRKVMEKLYDAPTVFRYEVGENWNWGKTRRYIKDIEVCCDWAGYIAIAVFAIKRNAGKPFMNAGTVNIYPTNLSIENGLFPGYKPKLETTCEGKPLTLSVEGGQPEKEYHWYKPKNGIIPEVDHITLDDLEFLGVSSTHTETFHLIGAPAKVEKRYFADFSNNKCFASTGAGTEPLVKQALFGEFQITVTPEMTETEAHNLLRQLLDGSASAFDEKKAICYDPDEQVELYVENPRDRAIRLGVTFEEDLDFEVEWFYTRPLSGVAATPDAVGDYFYPNNIGSPGNYRYYFRFRVINNGATGCGGLSKAYVYDLEVRPSGPFTSRPKDILVSDAVLLMDNDEYAVEQGGRLIGFNGADIRSRIGVSFSPSSLDNHTTIEWATLNSAFSYELDDYGDAENRAVAFSRDFTFYDGLAIIQAKGLTGINVMRLEEKDFYDFYVVNKLVRYTDYYEEGPTCREPGPWSMVSVIPISNPNEQFSDEKIIQRSQVGLPLTECPANDETGTYRAYLDLGHGRYKLAKDATTNDFAKITNVRKHQVDWRDYQPAGEYAANNGNPYVCYKHMEDYCSSENFRKTQPGKVSDDMHKAGEDDLEQQFCSKDYTKLNELHFDMQQDGRSISFGGMPPVARYYTTTKYIDHLYTVTVKVPPGNLDLASGTNSLPDGENSGLSTIGTRSGSVSDNLKVFPNPSGGQVTVQSLGSSGNGLKEINLYGVDGKKWKQWPGISGKQKTIDVSDVAIGVYVLEVVSDTAFERILLKVER